MDGGWTDDIRLVGGRRTVGGRLVDGRWTVGGRDVKRTMRDLYKQNRYFFILIG